MHFQVMVEFSCQIRPITNLCLTVRIDRSRQCYTCRPSLFLSKYSFGFITLRGWWAFCSSSSDGFSDSLDNIFSHSTSLCFLHTHHQYFCTLNIIVLFAQCHFLPLWTHVWCNQDDTSSQLPEIFFLFFWENYPFYDQQERTKLKCNQRKYINSWPRLALPLIPSLRKHVQWKDVIVSMRNCQTWPFNCSHERYWVYWRQHFDRNVTVLGNSLKSQILRQGYVCTSFRHF